MPKRRPVRSAPPLRLPPIVSIGLGGAAVLAAAVLIAILVGGGFSGQGGQASVPQIQAYDSGIRTPLGLAAAIVKQGMKPSVRDFAGRTLDPASFTARAHSWQVNLQAAKTRFDSVQPPPGMEAAQAGFDRALDAYIQAAAQFEVAGKAAPDAQLTLLAAAVATGRRGDSDYSAASAQVQAALAGAGLPRDLTLPDPTPT